MADIAIFRINYKSDFILTLQSDAGWLTPFCIKFWTGAPSQAYYAYYDGMSYTHCTPVEGEPTKLLVQFDDHHLPIGDLKFQIGYHFTVADFPTSIEDEVINQAAVIIDNDGERQQVMLDFNGETAPEIQFALPAYANEAQRIANEQARITAEEQRIANEQARISAEETRQANEQQRINAEAERVSDFASLKTESEAATAAANIAATLANEKAQLADDKAALAQAAADLANAKAQLAADKAALAQAAATLANGKAVLAQQKAEYAQEQGDAAKTEAETAHALNEEVRDDEEARDQAEQIRQQQETARQQAESQRVTDFNAQMQQQQTAYADAEAARDTAFDEAETERDAKVDAKVADITNMQAQIGYFVCDTGASVAAKTIAATGYVLGTGGNIRIRMTNANTADSVTLNINNTGAKALFYNGTQASSTNSWEAGEVIEVYYDGTQYQAKEDDIRIEKTFHSYNITTTNSSYVWVFSPRFQVSKGDFIRYKLMGRGTIVFFYHDTTTAATSGEPLVSGTSDSQYNSGELEIQEDGYIAFRSHIKNTINESYGEHYQKIPIEHAIKVNSDDIADINLKNNFDKYEFDMSTSNSWRSSSYIYVNVGDILVINNFNVTNNADMVNLYSDRGTTLIKKIALGTGSAISATYIMDTAGYLFFRNHDGNGNAILYLKSSSLTLREMLKVTVPFNRTDTDPAHWKRTKPYRVIAGDTYEVSLQGASGSFLRLYADEECTQLLEDISGSTTTYKQYTKLVGTISANGYLVARAGMTANNAYCYIYKQSLAEYLGNLSVTGRNITIASSTSSSSDKNIAQVVCTGLHDEQTVQSVIDLMGGYGVIYFKAGVYFIDGFTDDVNGGPSYAMRIPYNSNFRFVGDIQSYDAGSNIQSFSGVRFAVTDTAYSSCDDNGLYAVFGGTKGGPSDDAHIIMTESVEFEHVCVSLPNNQKPIICFDGWNVGQMRVSKFLIKTPFNNRGTITSIGIDNCIGIRGHQGSNNGADSVFESGYIVGLGVACSVCGEHTKWIDLDCIGNKYAYWVNQFASEMAVGVNAHPITIIGCTDEVSTRFMRFGANPYRQVIDIINFEMEVYPPNFAIGNSYATEDVPGQWYGNIDYSLQEFASGDTYYLKNSPTRKFWADGHGKNMNSRNNAQKQVVTSTELLTYAPNFNQIVYCITLDKPLICTNPSTKEWRDFNGTIVNLSQ